MFHFYVPGLVPPHAVLPPDESHHCANVLRLRPPAAVTLLDGQGGVFDARLTSVSAKACRAEVVSHATAHERNYRLHVALAPTRQVDRTEWFVEKAVELGVDQITFLLTDRSERRHLRLDRLEKLVVSAMKQSQRAWLPRLHGPEPLAHFLARPAPGVRRLVAHLAEGPRVALAARLEVGVAAYEVLIGPEGDFTPDEVAAARAAAFEPVTLGAFRLRTETAGVAVCHALALLVGQGGATPAE